MKQFISIFILLALAGCDSYIGKIEALGSSAHIECWSGNTKIYDGYSTGKVVSETHSDGYFFKEKETGRVLEVSGNCIINYSFE